MPSAFAHAAVGAALSRALPPHARRPWLPWLLAALAAAPDLDVLAFALGIPYEHPLGHRGLSHSLPFAALVAALAYAAARRRPGLPAAPLALAVFAAVASHGLLDAFTDAGLGIGLLLPFDDARIFWPWRPIATSPLSVGAFFSERGLAILTNEALFVGFPTLVFLLVVAVLRRARVAYSRS